MKQLIKPAILAISVLTALPGLAEQKLLIQSYAYEGEEMFDLQRAWLDEMEIASDGQVKFNLVSAGDAVFYTETLDAMRLGVLDGHFSAVGYFSSRDPGVTLLSNVVGAWSDANEYLRFMYDGGGNELLENFYNGHNVHLVGSFSSGLEAFVSKVPVNGVADLSGLRIRVPDDMVGRVFAAAGAEPVSLPGSQIIPALESGTIDASDYSVFTVNQNAGLNDVAPNPVFPGFHSVPVLDFSIAQDKWKLIPSDVQSLLNRSIRDFAQKTIDQFQKEDLEIVAKAEENPKITVHNWPPEERRKFREIAQKEWKAVAEESPFAKQTYEVVIQFLSDNNML